MNTPPRKLLNIAKNIIAKSPEIPAMIHIVPLISIFLSSSCWLSRCDSGGNESERRWSITRSVTVMLIPTAQSIPSRPIMSHEKTDTTVNTRPFTAPICPFALSRHSSGMRMVTRVESAIIRILPTTTPSIITKMKSQSQGFHISVHADSGKYASIPNASE